jgi:plasmid stabilization system protein ParE
MKVVYAERARRDIARIYETIAGKNPAAALRVEHLIRKTCDRLGDFPYAAASTD